MTLTVKEQKRLYVLIEVLAGRITNLRASEILGVSERHFYRLKVLKHWHMAIVVGPPHGGGSMLRSRDELVLCRTLLINHTLDIVKASGSRLPSCSADYFARKVEADIPEPLQPALLPILDSIASLTQQIKSYDREAEDLCDGIYPETKLMRRINGVGPIYSACLYPHP